MAYIETKNLHILIGTVTGLIVGASFGFLGPAPGLFTHPGAEWTLIGLCVGFLTSTAGFNES